MVERKSIYKLFSYSLDLQAKIDSLSFTYQERTKQIDISRGDNYKFIFQREIITFTFRYKTFKIIFFNRNFSYYNNLIKSKLTGFSFTKY
jgi:hypothetical protein